MGSTTKPGNLKIALNSTCQRERLKWRDIYSRVFAPARLSSSTKTDDWTEIPMRWNRPDLLRQYCEDSVRTRSIIAMDAVNISYARAFYSESHS